MKEKELEKQLDHTYKRLLLIAKQLMLVGGMASVILLSLFAFVLFHARLFSKDFMIGLFLAGTMLACLILFLLFYQSINKSLKKEFPEDDLQKKLGKADINKKKNDRST
ncbi:MULTISPECIES: hypothetical protein [unclassified Enterococcus]|uniref:hypothetical protein n=1 Tax=unclassified Enterococcus TaxID=2608891 RepID=UPI0013EAFDF9|nr:MULTISPECIES: hypothetical protein [unclassified Enterococcus]